MPTTAPTAPPVESLTALIVAVTALVTALGAAAVAVLKLLPQVITAIGNAREANTKADATAERLASVEQRVHETALATKPAAADPAPATDPAWVPVHDLNTDRPKGS